MTTKRRGLRYAALAAAGVLSGITGNVIGRQIDAQVVSAGDWLSFAGALLGAAATVAGAGYLAGADHRRQRAEADRVLEELCRRWLLDLEKVRIFVAGDTLRFADSCGDQERLMRTVTIHALNRLRSAPDMLREVGVLAKSSSSYVAICVKMAVDALQEASDDLRHAALKIRKCIDDTGPRPNIGMDEHTVGTIGAAFNIVLHDLGADVETILDQHDVLEAAGEAA